MYIKNIKELKRTCAHATGVTGEKMNGAKNSSGCFDSMPALTLEEYTRADTIFIYVSKPIEVDTLAIINAVLANHKKVAVPRCVPDTFDMEFYYITSLSDLEKGTFGVLEPIVTSANMWEIRMDVRFVLCQDSVLMRKGIAWDMGRAIKTAILHSSAVSQLACVTWGASSGICPMGITTGLWIFLITEKYVRRIARQEDTP